MSFTCTRTYLSPLSPCKHRINIKYQPASESLTTTVVPEATRAKIPHRSFQNKSPKRESVIPIRCQQNVCLNDTRGSIKYHDSSTPSIPAPHAGMSVTRARSYRPTATQGGRAGISGCGTEYPCNDEDGASVLHARWPAPPPANIIRHRRSPRLPTGRSCRNRSCRTRSPHTPASSSSAAA